MIPAEVIGKISELTGIVSKPLIEKDLYLQGLLIALSKEDYFVGNFVFKGGTCLTKAYFGYYRFSEDLDFTWINQELFEAKTENKIRKTISLEINKIMGLLEKAAKQLELDFKKEKSNTRYVQLGGSNRFVTFKFWYLPTAGDQETFIKIQLNFIDKIFTKPKKRGLMAIATEYKKDMEFLYPRYAPMALQSPSFYCYGVKEIAAEKIRALLTRRGFKARDVIDLYMLYKHGITINSVKPMAFEKTKFMLKYLKYAENLKNKHFEEKFDLEKEQNLMVKRPRKDFEAFANNTLKELNELAEEFRGKLEQKA